MRNRSGGLLILANHFEYTGQCIDDRFGPSEERIWYRGSASLSDHALFWGEGEGLVVVSEGLHPTMVEDVRCFFGVEALDVLHVRGAGTSLCHRILLDSEASERVQRYLRQEGGVEVLAWGMTPALGDLLRRWAAVGLDPRLSGLPAPEELWLVQLLDSKPGFRLLAEELNRDQQQIPVPEGLILPDFDTALEAAGDHFLSFGKSAVLKAARGTGGYSTLLVPPSGHPWEEQASFRRLRSVARFDSFWTVGSVVAERFVKVSAREAPSAFTVDAFVTQDCTTEICCLGRMLIAKGKRYEGVIMGKGAVSSGLRVQLCDAVSVVGQALADRGFVGLFDLDFVVDDEEVAWVCEMNVRRASPSHVLAIARRAFGPDWETSGCVLGRDYVKLQGSLRLGYDDLRCIVNSFRSRSPASVDLLITQASFSLQRRSPYFGYALLAEDAASCVSEADRFERFLYESLGLSLDAVDARPWS